MGIYVKEHYTEDYGVAFGTEIVERQHGPYANATTAWEKVVELSMRDIYGSEGTMAIFPYEAICFQEDSNQKHSDWWHSILQEEEP